jgi:mannose-6-phosphate isomerase
LFKVLSIDKVLSIQAQPDKHLAPKLHEAQPSVYKDPNHKPEMAVVLDDNFEAMSGFRPVTEIASNILEYPEMANIIGTVSKIEVINAAEHNLGANPKPILQRLFRSYMTARKETISEILDTLVNRLTQKKEESKTTDLDNLILKLADQFPGDSGIFAPIIFNYLKLNKGDAFFIGANEPHAYIQGEILECMACSDNVVRAGLTPKLKDVETLVKMLTYKSTSPKITQGEKIDPNCRLYVPPVEDFAIELIEIPAGSSYLIPDVGSPSVLLTLEGSGKLQQNYSIDAMDVSFGKAAFMSANTTAMTIADDDVGLKLVRALSNVHL